jgi:F-type H+/Na+-transporting ATPase subunit alpha
MQTVQIHETGKIKEVKGSVAKIVGLSRCMTGQLVELTARTKGIITGFTLGEAHIFLIGQTDDVRVGDQVVSQIEPFTIPVGDAFIGRVVNALAEPVDGKGAISPTGVSYPVFKRAPGVMERVPIKEVLETGILMIDSAVPIGKGQRELIIGDRMTGKTTVCIDTILNQWNKDVICIYCCIGRSQASLQKVIVTLQEKGAMNYTIVVAAQASSSSGEQYLAPYSACALGEYFMDKGRDVFVVFDDLTKHAWVYRQLSLLLERSPGRDAYPGDIFYLHSQIMERAAQYSPEFKGGSMTFFPMVDTLQGDITGYIPSNLVSMTDGQIYLDTNLFNRGMKPAIDLGLSVSRIGNKVQSPMMKEMSATLRLDTVRYNNLLKISRFRSEASEKMTKQLKQGEILIQLFSQEAHESYPHEKELIFLYALKRGVLKELSRRNIGLFKERVFAFLENKFPTVIEELRETRTLSPRIAKQLNEGLLAFFREMGLTKTLVAKQAGGSVDAVTPKS